ncbi:glycine betaine ABC transporter substrate-binding protein [Salimicrobium flavidum]|uniref:Glycine betaine/proline transport system substrate-binding protein n=1 Tax=Salimicrobium flavidum TaxID=570947 RepID=A0A1N7JIM2_9BACI|nr:glycine betaine ABC transporter substrate-binding protein [Salimicrobium flavidum]SIS49193.1 glycine betaine/proline transport system substrate-binding protein [Salimicrobium flavidum]
MKKLFITLMTITMVSILAACGSTEEGSAENEASGEKETITLGVTPWTSTVPPTEVAQLVIEDMGYNVEQTQADVASTFMGLSGGDIDAYMDSWMPVHEVYFEKYSDSIEDTATSYDDAASGLVIPEYVEGVNTISDLKGNEDKFGNTIYGIEEGASATEELRDLIEEYDLDMELVPSSEGGMMAQAQKDMSKEKPVVFYGWRPHTMFNKFDIKLLEDEDGFFESASVHVVTNKNLEEKAPDVYNFLSNWSISIDDVEEMILKIEEGADKKDVAKEWIENNKDKIDNMRQ